jgi:hypothetical protein
MSKYSTGAMVAHQSDVKDRLTGLKVSIFTSGIPADPDFAITATPMGTTGTLAFNSVTANAPDIVGNAALSFTPAFVGTMTWALIHEADDDFGASTTRYRRIEEISTAGPYGFVTGSLTVSSTAAPISIVWTRQSFPNRLAA